MGSMGGKAHMEPPPWMGSGEVEHRYELKPLPPLPWYYDQSKMTWFVFVAFGIFMFALQLVF